MIPNPSLSTKTETTIKLPLSFILFGLGSFVFSQLVLFLNSEALFHGYFRIPELLMGAHFLLLGWVVMVVMGSMYQLVPVAFLTPIWSEKLGFVQLIITALGVTVFSLLLGFKPNVAVYGATLVVVGILLFLYQMIRTLMKQEQKNTMTLFVVTALFCFFLTILAGFLLAWNMAFGGSFNYSAVFHSHILLGVAGWFSLLIFGFSYKMVPMFSLSHGFSMKYAKFAFISYAMGLFLLIISFWLSNIILTRIGWVLLLIGFTCFSFDMREIIHKRIKKKLDRPFVFSLISIIYGWIIHVIAVVLSLLSITSQTVWSWLIFAYIVSWIIFSILGYLYKIVPFLWWTHKYSGLVGKEKVPLLKNMIDEKLGSLIFILLPISVFGLVTAALFHINFLVLLFQGLMLSLSILYSISIIRVLFQKP